MKPIMMQKEDPRAKDESTDEVVEESNQEPELPDAALKLIAGAKAILFSDEMVEGFKKVISSAKDFSTGASMMCFSLMSKAQDNLDLDLPPDILYGDGGVSDNLLDAIYAYGQQVGVEEASDQQSYIAAMDMVEDFGMQLESGVNQAEQNPMQQAPQNQPKAQNQGAPIMMG